MSISKWYLPWHGIPENFILGSYISEEITKKQDSKRKEIKN